MEPSIELIQAPPAELVLALDTFHKFTATCTHDTDFTSWADLGAKYFVEVAV